MAESNHSLSYCYNAPETEDLSFNRGPISTIHHEKPTFLQIPIKRNCSAIKSSLIPKFKSQMKSVIKHRINGIRFKKELMPIISFVDFHKKLSLENIGESGKSFLCQLELLMPTETQWETLDMLRLHAGSPDRSSEGLEKLAQYYSCLCSMEKKFPFSTGQILLDFSWTEAFSERSVTSSCIQYEKACVLFNAAAVYSYLGASQRLWAPKGKQIAADFFQRSAGILHYIRDHLVFQISEELGVHNDLHERSLSAFSSVMLAQAIECYYEKTVQEQSSSGITSMVAAQTSDLYASCVRHLKADVSCWDGRCPKEWLIQSKCKWRLFNSIAHFHFSSGNIPEKAVSEREARLSIAKNLVIQAFQLAAQVSRELEAQVQSHAKCIIDAHDIIESANNELFNQYQIDPRLLSPVKRPAMALVNPIPAFESLKPQEQFDDMFHTLTSPKYRNDVLNLYQEYHEYVQNGNSNLQQNLEELDLLCDKYKFLSKSWNNSQNSLNSLINKNQLDGNEMLDKLNKLKTEENIIKCEDMISNLEISMNSAEASQNNETIQKLKNELIDLKLQFETKCADFSPLDWTMEKISAVIPFHSFESLIGNDDKFSKSISNLLKSETIIRKECNSASNLLCTFEKNQEKFLFEKDNFVKNIQEQKNLLSKAKSAFSLINSKKSELFKEISDLSNLLEEQEKSSKLILEFSKTTDNFERIRTEVENLLNKYAIALDIKSDSIVDNCLRVRSVLDVIKNSQHINSFDKNGINNSKSPQLNVFHFKTDTNIQNAAIPEQETIRESTLKNECESVLAIEKGYKKLNIKLPSFGELKFRLLKENARLKDRIYSNGDSIISNINEIKPNIEEISRLSLNEFLPNASSNIKFERQDLNNDIEIAKAKKVEEWVNQQKLSEKIENFKNNLPQRKEKDIDSESDAELNRSMIYMASVAAAAATSASLTTARRRFSIKNNATNLNPESKIGIKKIRKASKASASGVERKDSGIAPIQSEGSTADSYGVFNDEEFSKAQIKNSLSKMKYENKKMVQLLGSNQN